MKIGIDQLSFYVPHYYYDLCQLAALRGIQSDKYTVGIGQEKMAISPPDEDIVTMAANAAADVIRSIDISNIDLLIFATESGIDQSKAASLYVHSLLGLPSHCRTIELKQACCSSTAGLEMAYNHVAQHPKSSVLLVASDIARYGLGNAGEPTQGAGAVAVLITENPRIVELEPTMGIYAEDVMDFWRPNYLEEAVVDGKYSIKVYLRALANAWENYQLKGGVPITSFDRFCYHLPFTKMGEKGHQHLLKITEQKLSKETINRQIGDGLKLNRQIGNSYTASLYIGLIALLEHATENLEGQRIGMFAYGSGCMGLFFGGVVQPGYRQALDTENHRQMLESRISLSQETYEQLYRYTLPTDGGTKTTPRYDTGHYRLAGMEQHKRLYEKCKRPSHAAPHLAESIKASGAKKEQPGLLHAV